MTADEIQRRVDAWLAARDGWDGWTHESARRRFLVGQWRHVCPVFGADSDAALGVLIGMVGEAWVGVEFTIVEREDGCWFQSFGSQRLSVSGHRCEVLVAALEAAP